MSNPQSDDLKRTDIKPFEDKYSLIPRDNLINKAVLFLSNNKIQNQDPKLVHSFLIKKGLTEDEANIAFLRHHQTKHSLFVEQNASVPHHLHPLPVPSVWHTIHTTVTTITSVGGILYALYWLFKTYIYPYLFGAKQKRKPVETSLAELEAAVSSCTAEVKTIRSSVDTLVEQKVADIAQGVVVARLQEVKSEINSLKAILLNRNQFPAVPVPVGSGPMSIPVWQLNVSDTEPQEEDKTSCQEPENGSNGTNNGSDSSLEIVKDPNN